MRHYDITGCPDFHYSYARQSVSGHGSHSAPKKIRLSTSTTSLSPVLSRKGVAYFRGVRLVKQWVRSVSGNSVDDRIYLFIFIIFLLVCSAAANKFATVSTEFLSLSSTHIGQQLFGEMLLTIVGRSPKLFVSHNKTSSWRASESVSG